MSNLLFFNTNTQINSDKLAYCLFKDLNDAFYQFKMIQDRDKIAGAVPGRKDSLTLLILLVLHRSKVKENRKLWRFNSVNIRSDHLISSDFDRLVQLSNPPLGSKKVVIPESKSLSMNCHRCSWTVKNKFLNLHAECTAM